MTLLLVGHDPPPPCDRAIAGAPVWVVAADGLKAAGVDDTDPFVEEGAVSGALLEALLCGRTPCELDPPLQAVMTADAATKKSDLAKVVLSAFCSINSSEGSLLGTSYR